MSNFGRAPAVFSSEVDATITAASISTTEAAIAGVYRWGPVDQRVLVNNENTYGSIFGPPTNLNAETWFSGANFLAYSDALYVARSANTSGTTSDITNTATNAIATANGAPANTVLLGSIVKNQAAYEGVSFDSSVAYVAKYPGELGNSLRISTCASADAFNKTIDLIANTDIAANTAVVFTPGSNAAIVTIQPSGTGTANTALAAANTLVQSLVAGDVLKIGDNSTGTQYVSVTSVGTPALAGNTVTVSVSLSNQVTLFDTVTSNTINRFWEFHNLVDKAPSPSLYQASTTNGGVTDEVHVVVIDEDGKFTGIPGAVLEVFGGASRATDAKRDNGTSNFYKNVINQTSKFVWVGAGPADIVTGTATALVAPVQSKAVTYSLAYGQDGQDESTVPVAVLARAWDLFVSADDVNISYLIQGKSRTNVLANYIKDSIAEVRKDCIAVISPAVTDLVGTSTILDNLIAFRRTLGSSSYGELDGNFKYQYDKYNDVFRWVPLSGDIAGLMARSSAGTAPWMSPGGYSRGRIKNVVKLAWNPTQADRDALYREDINPVYNVVSQGPVLMGDKTLIGKNSAFSHINVRQLFILLRKNISAAAADLLFDINDDFTQAQFRNMTDPLLRDVQGRRGITSYKIVCDETNNTTQVIDNNGFAGDIYVSPARSINTIQLNFVATRTGVDFTEVVGNF